MWQPKVLTVAGVMVILACGACFLPPIPPPRPRVPPHLAGVTILAIQVEDGSGSDPFQEESMSRETATQFNRLWQEYPVHAIPWKPGITCDEVLRITVLSKSILPSQTSGGRQPLELEIVADFSIIAPSGVLLWQQPAKKVRFTHWFQAAPPAPIWKLHEAINGAAYNLAMSGGDVFFSRSLPQPQEHP
jgi:hypothetical protein